MAHPASRTKSPKKHKDKLISFSIGAFALIWLLPIVWAIWSSLRPYSEIEKSGLFSLPKSLTLQNYRIALEKMDVVKYFINTIIIIIPSVLFILLFGSLIAFAISRYEIRYRKVLLLAFTAGSMLPAQFIYYPIFKIYIFVGEILGNKVLFYDNYLGVILVHIALHTGFAAFVLHGQLQNIPKDISEAAEVDGASIFQHYYSVMLPMIKAPLASLSILFTVWVYNDFFWAWSLLKRDEFFPITTSLTRVGAFNRVIPDQNVLAAGAVLVALPLLLFYLILRRYFYIGSSYGIAQRDTLRN